MQTIKIQGLDRWKRLGETALHFNGQGARRVRLHLNSPGTVLTWATVDGGDIQFLARTEGYQIIEFYAEGAVTLNFDGEEIWWHCAETEPTYVEVRDPAIFTKIANRRHRNPELEEMMYRMQLNMEARLAQQKEEMQYAIEAARQREAGLVQPPANQVVTDAPGAAANAGGGTAPEPVPTAPAPVQEPATGGGSEPEGDTTGAADNGTPAG